jgi:hypothetical protein
MLEDACTSFSGLASAIFPGSDAPLVFTPERVTKTSGERSEVVRE